MTKVIKVLAEKVFFLCMCSRFGMGNIRSVWFRNVGTEEWVPVALGPIKFCKE